MNHALSTNLDSNASGPLVYADGAACRRPTPPASPCRALRPPSFIQPRASSPRCPSCRPRTCPPPTPLPLHTRHCAPCAHLFSAASLLSASRFSRISLSLAWSSSRDCAQGRRIDVMLVEFTAESCCAVLLALSCILLCCVVFCCVWRGPQAVTALNGGARALRYVVECTATSCTVLCCYALCATVLGTECAAAVT